MNKSNKSLIDVQTFLWIGKYRINVIDEHSVWIQGDGGEGGAFSSEALFKLIDKFYKKEL